MPALPGIFAVVLLFLSALAAHSQEALRMSLASADAAEARRKAAATIGYYNLKIGPTAWRFGAGLGLEYNDNVLLTQENQLDDLIFHPEITAQMLCPITDNNAISLNFGAGYSAYVLHPELDRIYIAPGSELSFDLYVGDFWINLHDRFSITENSYQDPTVTGTGNYSRLENALGVAATWDLNKLILRSGYDHVNYVALSGNNGQPDGESELISASAGYALKPGMITGMELGVGLIHYTGTNAFFSDAKQWSAGLFFETPISQYLRFRGSVGYTDYAPEKSPDSTGVYAQIDIQHRVNQFVDYTLTGGRSINFAFYGGSVDLSYARLLANWKIMRKVSIGTSVNYDHGSQIGSGGETFDRYGAGITLSRNITSKLSAILGDQFYWRTSNIADREYVNNIVSVNFNYAF